jgi:hypothetical protein
MLKRSISLGSISISMFLALSVSAEELPLSYSHFEVAYQTGELLDEEYDGLGISGSVAILDSVFLIGSYNSLTSNDEYYYSSYEVDDIELTQFSLGIGAHATIAASSDFLASISYVDNELEFAGLSAEGNGYSVSLGIRTKPSRELELMAQFNYANIEDETETGYNFSARIFPVEKVSFGLMYSSADELDALSLGVRFDI